MPVRLIAPIVSRHELTRTDKTFGCEGEPTYVEFRQAMQREFQQRDQLISQITREIKSNDSDDSITLKQDWSMEQLFAREVYLTLAGCNLVSAETDEPLFSFKRSHGSPVLDMSESEFMKAWGSLDTFITSEIVEKCHDSNLWDVKGKKN